MWPRILMEKRDEICLPIIAVVLVFLNLKLTYADPVFCPNNTTYPIRDSHYPNNLNALFQSLSSAAATSATGYAARSVESGTNYAVYGIFMCQGDLTPSSCRECVNAVNLTKEKCQWNKVGFVWLDYYVYCIIRFANQSFIGTMDPTLRSNISNDHQISSSNLTWFEQVLKNTMKDLARQAANGSEKKYATKVVNISPSFQNLYVLEQCTPDLSPSDCISCLTIAFGHIQDMTRMGGRIMLSSCYLRYEVYPFFNAFAPPTSAPTHISPGFTTIPTGEKRRMRKARIMVIVLLLIGLVMLLAVVSIWFSQKQKRKMHKQVESNNEIKCVDSLQLDYEMIQDATENFSDARRLEKDTSTAVYKGLLPGGQEMAVKRLFSYGKDSELEFENEVRILANLQHRNLVKLLGFCIKKDERLLIRELLPNGSLIGFLNDPIKRTQLQWELRHKIMSGIARGLLYLHEDSQVTIIHRDLKANNILLGVEMDPKISNFGKASRIYENEPNDGGTSKINGTYGYMPPEYAQEGYFSIKSDVFSFGVLLLEIINGHTISDFSDNDENEESLISFAWRKWWEGKALDVVDETMHSIENYKTEILKCIKISLLCIQEDPACRPTMSAVVFMFNSNINTIAKPSTPAFILQCNTQLPLSSSSDYSVHLNQSSVYEASVSEFGPR